MIPASERSGWTVWLLTTLIVGGALYLFASLEPDTVLPKMGDGLQIEAETAQLSGAVAVGEDEKASQGEYVYLNGSDSDDFTNQAAFCFSVSENGTYAIAARARSVAENSTFLIRIDYFDPWLWESPRGGFTWEEVTAEDGQTAKFRLESGSHVVSIAPQAEGMGLDLIEIVAIGGASPAAACPNDVQEPAPASVEPSSSDPGGVTTATSSTSASRLATESNERPTPEDGKGTEPTVETTSTTKPSKPSTTSTTSTPKPTAPPNTIPGGVLITPGQSIQAAVDAYPEGTTFVIGAGVHTGQSVKPKTGDKFIGQTGGVLDGGNTIPEAFTGGGDNVLIEGLIIRNYASTSGAIKSEGDARGWTIRNNEIHDNHIGIRIHSGWRVLANHVHSNQRYGIVGGGANVLIDGNEISFNNTSHYDINDNAGGTKFLRTDGLTLRNNNVHDNYGTGLWTDTDNINLLVEGNTVRNNSGAGILHEIGYDAIIRNNVVVGNGFAQPGWVSGAGILVSNSSNVEIYGNVIRANNDGVGGIQTNRGSGAYGAYVLKNLYVHDNHIVLTAGQNGIARADYVGNEVYTDYNNRFENNRYESYSDAPFRWVDNKSYTWDQWQSFGQDLGGRFD